MLPGIGFSFRAFHCFGAFQGRSVVELHLRLAQTGGREFVRFDPIRKAEGITHGTAQVQGLGQGFALAVAGEPDGGCAFLLDRSVFAICCHDIFILDPVRRDLCLGSGVEIEAAVLGCLFVDIGNGDGDGEVLVEEQAARVGGADADGVGVLVS